MFNKVMKKENKEMKMRWEREKEEKRKKGRNGKGDRKEHIYYLVGETVTYTII